MIKLELAKDGVEPKAKPLPNKEERKQLKKEAEVFAENRQIIGDLCADFYNEKLAVLKIPLSEVEEGVPNVLRAIIQLIKGRSTLSKESLAVKRKIEEINICDLEKYVDKN